jgi:Rho GTPase-activating protein 1
MCIHNARLNTNTDSLLVTLVDFPPIEDAPTPTTGENVIEPFVVLDAPIEPSLPPQRPAELSHIAQLTAVSALPPFTGRLTAPTPSSSNERPKTTPASSSSSSSSSTSSTAASSSKHGSTYDENLAMAKRTNFDAIREAHFAYQSGVDFAGRPVVVVCGAMPANASADDLFLYIINLLDPITEGDYSVVYVVMSEGKKPSFSWLRKVYGTITRKYKKNLKQLFIVNPSFWVKAGFQFFRPFVSGKFWKKVVYVSEVRQLYQYMSPTQIRFPDYVTHQAGFIKNSNAMFGQSLDMAMAHPMNEGLQIPILIQSAIEAVTANGLEVEGIFRISGNATRIKQLQETFDKGNTVNLIEEDDIHAVAGLLKRYLRELPEPIIPFSLFPLLISVATDHTPDDIKQALIQAQLCELTPTAFIILDRLIRLMVKIASHESKNRMGASNLAIVLGPNIMYGQDAPGDPTAAMTTASSVIAIVAMLINHSETLLSAGRLKFEC